MLRNKKKQIADTHGHMDEPLTHCAEGKQPDTRLYETLREKVQSTVTERSVVTCDQGWGGADQEGTRGSLLD